MEHHDASDGDEATNPFIDEEEPLLEARPRRRRSKTIIVAAGALVVSAAALTTRSRTTNLEAENRLPVPLDLANCANFDDDAAMRDGCVGMTRPSFAAPGTANYPVPRIYSRVCWIWTGRRCFLS